MAQVRADCWGHSVREELVWCSASSKWGRWKASPTAHLLANVQQHKIWAAQNPQPSPCPCHLTNPLISLVHTSLYMCDNTIWAAWTSSLDASSSWSTFWPEGLLPVVQDVMSMPYHYVLPAQKLQISTAHLTITFEIGSVVFIRVCALVSACFISLDVSGSSMMLLSWQLVSHTAIQCAPEAL